MGLPVKAATSPLPNGAFTVTCRALMTPERRQRKPRKRALAVFVPVWGKRHVDAPLSEDGDNRFGSGPAPRVHSHAGRDETVLAHPARQVGTGSIGRRADAAICTLGVGIGVLETEVVVETG